MKDVFLALECSNHLDDRRAFVLAARRDAVAAAERRPRGTWELELRGKGGIRSRCSAQMSVQHLREQGDLAVAKPLHTDGLRPGSDAVGPDGLRLLRLNAPLLLDADRAIKCCDILLDILVEG